MPTAQALLWPHLVNAGFKCHPAADQEFDVAFLTFLLAVDEHVNVSLYWPTTRLWLMVAAYRAGKGRELTEVQRRFVKAVNERAKPRFWDGKLKSVKQQRRMFEDIWNGLVQVPVLKSSHWKEIGELVQKHMGARSNAGSLSPHLEQAYTLFAKLAAPDVRYAIDNVVVSTPAFLPSGHTSDISPCTDVMDDQTFASFKKCFESEAGLLILREGVEKLGLMPVMEALQPVR